MRSGTNQEVSECRSKERVGVFISLVNVQEVCVEGCRHEVH